MPTLRKDGKLFVKYFRDIPQWGDRKIVVYNPDGEINLTIQRVGDNIVSAGPGMMNRQINRGVMEFLDLHGNFYQDDL